MQTELNNTLLVNDSQLGDRLNQAVSEGRRSDFGLLLSMLSEDARDLPRVEESKNEQGEPDWREYFSLPDANPLYAQAQDEIRAPQLSSLAGELYQDSLRMMLAMRAEPLKVNNDALPYEVSSNLDPRTQARLAGKYLTSSIPQDPSRIMSVLEGLKA
ncbi:MAG: VC2046/SO_2500 family protein [Oceanisphaera sp.]